MTACAIRHPNADYDEAGTPIACTLPVGHAGEHAWADATFGGADLRALVAGLVAAFLVALVLSFAPSTPTHAVAVDSVSTVTPSPVVTREVPPVPVAVSPLSTELIPPATIARPSTGTTAPPPATTTTTAPAPAVDQSCEVLSDGLDAHSGNGEPGWYRAVMPASAVALNPDHVRNCTDAILP